MIRCERATVERSGRVAVESLTLTVDPGQAVAVVGRTGAGKSSLLAAVATVLPLHAGAILVDGHAVDREAEQVRRRVGYVPDRLPAWPGLRVAEFLQVFAAAAGLHGQGLRLAVDRAVAMAGVEGERSTPLDDLPAGHRKRILVARALLHDPQVLVLDDPFGGLDTFERRDVARLIADAHLIDRTVLAAIDDADVPTCFTHLAVLAEGRLVASGPAEPAAFATGRSWRCRAVCRGSAEQAIAALRAAGVTRPRVDGDAVTFEVDAARPWIAAAAAALAAAGIDVEWIGFDPPWPAQLLG
jgi:ABC-2 type transport system ATP-binding protein